MLVHCSRPYPRYSWLRECSSRSSGRKRLHPAQLLLPLRQLPLHPLPLRQAHKPRPALQSVPQSRRLHALQVNLRGGRLPEPENDGRRYLKIPIDALPGAVWG